MKKVMAFGTFDILHKGHKYYLGEAKKHGDYLIVVVARDRNVERSKGELPLNDEQSRLERIAELDFVDEAVLGSERDIYSVIAEKNPGVLCLGYDQKVPVDFRAELKRRKLNPDIVVIDSYKPHIHKSSKLRQAQRK